MLGNQEKKPLVIRGIERLSEWSGYLSGLSILLSSVIIVYQVLTRYFLGVPGVWQIEVSIYLLLFTSFVGAAYGLKHDAHVGIDLLVVKMRPRRQKQMRIFTSLMCIALTGVVGWRAFARWWEATEQGWRADTLLSTPLSIPYFILPLGMTLVGLQFIVLIYEDWKALNAEKSSDNASRTIAAEHALEERGGCA
jgi:TRAP-type C4-dicarboxylate transport system permease small subunit